MSLLFFNMLSGLVRAFLPRSKCFMLIISRLQSPFTVILIICQSYCGRTSVAVKSRLLCWREWTGKCQSHWWDWSLFVNSIWPLWHPLFSVTNMTGRINQALIFGCSLSSVQSLSHVWLFVIPWTAARQASLSITNSWRLLKLPSIE